MRIFTLSLLFVFAFTTHAAGGPPASKAKPNAEDLLQEIIDLNTDKSCTNSNDCASVALGAKECGGPAGYLVVSKRNKNYAKILERAKLHEAISKENVQLNAGNMVGNCQYLEPTTTICDGKKCVESIL